MFLNENRIVEKICEFPTTLGDISENIFGGISSKNSLLHRLVVPEGSGSESLYLCEGLCKPVILESELIYPYVSGSFPKSLHLTLHPTVLCSPMSCRKKTTGRSAE